MVMLTPPDDPSLADREEQYGYSNDFMMANQVNDVADHGALNLPMSKPKVKRNRKR